MKRVLPLCMAIIDRIHKELAPLSYARRKGIRFGKGCRFINVDFGSEPYLVSLGDHVSITSSYFITHDGALWVFRHKTPDADIFSPISVGTNVFIGRGCVILPGVNIGNDVIIGALSLVNKDIPDGVVAAGVPARPIGNLNAYWEKVKTHTMPTKRMTTKKKREYLLKHFHLIDSYSNNFMQL